MSKVKYVKISKPEIRFDVGAISLAPRFALRPLIWRLNNKSPGDPELIAAINFVYFTNFTSLAASPSSFSPIIVIRKSISVPRPKRKNLAGRCLWEGPGWERKLKKPFRMRHDRNLRESAQDGWDEVMTFNSAKDIWLQKGTAAFKGQFEFSYYTTENVSRFYYLRSLLMPFYKILN